MSKLKLEDPMTIQTLARKHVSHCEIARLLGTAEGAVRYQIKRMEAGGRRWPRAPEDAGDPKVGKAIAHWREQYAERALNCVFQPIVDGHFKRS